MTQVCGVDGFSLQILQAHLRPASFLILLFRHPHLLEAAQGGQNWATWEISIDYKRLLGKMQKLNIINFVVGGGLFWHIYAKSSNVPLLQIKKRNQVVKGILCFKLISSHLSMIHISVPEARWLQSVWISWWTESWSPDRGWAGHWNPAKM